MLLKPNRPNGNLDYLQFTYLYSDHIVNLFQLLISSLQASFSGFSNAKI